MIAALRRRLHHGAALVRRGAGGVAHGARRVVVLDGPAELGAPAVAQDGVARGALLRARRPVPRMLHAHRGGRQVQHHRGLDRAAVDAEAVLLGAEQAVHLIGQRQAEPAAAVDQQAAALAQLARHDVHGRHVAAMAVEQQQLPHARARHALAQLGPQRDQRGGRERERARVGQVLGGQAHVLRRQEQRRQAGGQQRQRGGDHALQERGIDRQRQVRPMLLDGGHGQHGHGPLRQARGARLREVAGAELGPPVRGEAFGRRRGRWHGSHLRTCLRATRS